MRNKVHGSWFMVHGLLVLVALFAAHYLLTTTAYAKEITILYTGETHSMLYPCSCPKEPDGGVARRAALVKQLKKNNPNTLLLDSGGFFAGGLMDEYMQNTDLDKARTLVNLKSMEMMGYDAAAVGDDEFNFDRNFLESSMNQSNFKFLSCNIKSDKFLPYIIKEIDGVRFGIIGLTTLSATEKTGGLKLEQPGPALRNAVQELKAKKADVIIVLSHLGESEDANLIDEVKGIDVLILGHSRAKEKSSDKIKSTIVLRPAWQGRQLGKLTLNISGGKIASYKNEELRLSDQIKDDPDILKILPKCFSDANCKRKGFVGSCQNPGAINSECIFTAPSRVSLTVVTPKECDICDTKTTVDYLQTQIPGLVVTYLYYPDAKAAELVKNLDVKGMPFYLLSKDIENKSVFAAMKDNLEPKAGMYLIKPQVSGISYFQDRKVVKGKLDIFISLYDKDTAGILAAIKEFNPVVHFLAVEQENGGFDAAKGNVEVEEYLRAVCVQKYYPQIFWDYIICRAGNIDSSWWEDCLDKFDPARIKNCAKCSEGQELLKENISLGKELKILFGPTYLVDNRQVFGTRGVPTKKELKKTLKR